MIENYAHIYWLLHQVPAAYDLQQVLILQLEDRQRMAPHITGKHETGQPVLQ